MALAQKCFGGTTSILALAALAALRSNSALAVTQTSTWLGPASGDWNTASHWSPAGVPNNGTNGISDYNVIIGPPSPTILDISPTIDTLTVNANSQLTINPGLTLTISGPTVTNNGTVLIDTLSSDAALNFAANTTLSGSGTVVLNDYNPNARITAAAGVTLTQAAGSTIQGVGEIDAALINSGTVNANYGGRSLVLQTGNMTNNNVFEATNTGLLNIAGITVTQGNNAQIYAGTNSGVSINSATITGGAIAAAAGGSISTSSATFNNVTIASGTRVNVAAATTLSIGGGALTNNGTIQVDNLSNNADLNFTTNTALNGSGYIFLDDYNPFARLTSNAGATVTQAATHTIYGIGEIDAALINNGTVNANQAIGNRTLALQTSNMTNNNVFEATNGATLSIAGITVTQGASGQIFAGTSSLVSISGGAVISGGMLTSAGGGSFNTSSAAFSNVTIAAGTQVTVAAGTTLSISSGTLTNNGTIQVDTLTSNADLNFGTTAALNGSGYIFLDDYNPNARITSTSAAVVTQAATHTIYGIGEIDAPLVNNGTVNANQNLGSHTLLLTTYGKTNNNIFQATNSGNLEINGITVTQGNNAQINAAASSTVTFDNGAVLSGGRITSGLGVINVNGGTFSGATVASGVTVSVVAGGTLTTVGGTVNNGALNVSGFANLYGLSGSGSLNIIGYNVTLPTGSGLSQQSALTITNTGSLDIKNNSFLVNYGAGNASPLSTLTGYVKTGYNNGAWNGSGITSSTAAMFTSRAIGIADSKDGAAAGQVLLKYTYYGDVNLDGKVDISDLTILASHFNASGVWTDGDINYDGKIDISDLTLLANNFQSGSASLMSFNQALAIVAAETGSSVPEPTMIVLPTFILALSRRRGASRA